MKRLMIFQVSAFFFFITLSFSARAEYYLVYPGTVSTVSYGNYYQAYTVCQTCYRRCQTCCTHPCGYSRGGYQVYYETPRVIEMRYVSPTRQYLSRQYISRGSEEVAEYAWVPYP